MFQACALGFAVSLLPVLLLPDVSTERADALLAMGVAKMKEGDFEAAVFALDSAVRKLEGSATRAGELARAYLYLGAAYVGLDHESAARGKFREALARDPGVRPNPEEMPRKVITVFEDEQARLTAVKSKRGRKVALLLAGGGAAAAVGVAAATGGGLPGNRPPQPAITVAPEGQAIVGVTIMHFTATASDPDGDLVSFAWDFGDGASAAGESAAHRYEREGTFLATLTGSDGKGGSAKATASITARTMSGSYFTGDSRNGSDSRLMCTQTGNRVDCLGDASTLWMRRFWVQIEDPRRVVDGEMYMWEAPPVRCVGGKVASMGGDTSDLQCLWCDDGLGAALFERLREHRAICVSAVT